MSGLPELLGALLSFSATLGAIVWALTLAESALSVRARGASRWAGAALCGLLAGALTGLTLWLLFSGVREVLA